LIAKASLFMMASSTFKDTVPFDSRREEAARILAKYPHRIPVIVEKALHSDLPHIDKKKFLVPSTMLYGELKYIVHKHVTQAETERMHAGQMAADRTLYLFVGTAVPKSSAQLAEVYSQHRASDGFLYVNYTAENTLGGCWIALAAS